MKISHLFPKNSMPGALKKMTVKDHKLIEIFYVDHCWTHPQNHRVVEILSLIDSQKSVDETPDVEFFTVVPLLGGFISSGTL